MLHSHSLLSHPAIMENLGRGVIIHPFDPKLLKTCSYDVRLGRAIYRMHNVRETGDYIVNPYKLEAVERRYGEAIMAPTVAELHAFLRSLRTGMPRKATDLSICEYERAVLASQLGLRKSRLLQSGMDFYELVKRWAGDRSAATLRQKADYFQDQLAGFSEDDAIVMLRPGEMILGHTMEFIGGTKDPDTGRCFTAEMKARSSAGRHGIEVCRCAGWGDVGYTLIWTMEINNTTESIVMLAVGTSLAQIKFYEVDPVSDELLYGCDSARDHYQLALDLQRNIGSWHSGMLMPKPLNIWRPSNL